MTTTMTKMTKKMTTATGLNANKSVPGARALRRQAARTRKELGRTVEALVSRAGSSSRVHETAERLRGTAASHVGRLVEDKNLDSVRGKAVRAATTARSHRTALLTAAGVLAAALLARRSRRARRGQAV
ncbi:DUF3618 domain-containing protein [Streptomyces sp. NBC_00335]|uniref:DUF3618 domain-containing protein n=1 Tax=unclassified Streptomyces TaxID=2593676 RepID=UPI0022566FA4|nr:MULTISPECIES: DUF3618 domain-containing protein [unclassified Streptomyces]MCX5409575.1 DUF3618 domain-containing protein [Streptomyces sp. NBC_00086]